MRTQVLGWHGRGNCGDDAFVSAFQELWPSKVFSFRQPSAEPVSLSSDETLILGGGDVVKPYYLDCIPKDMPFSAIGCGLGYESEVELLRDRNVKSVVLRNRKDAELAKSHGINAQYAPDLCFALQVGSIERQRLERKRPAKKKLGVILSAHALPGIEQPDRGVSSYFEFLQWELATIINFLAEWYEIYWISFSADIDNWDEAAHYNVRARMERRGGQTFIPYTPNTPLRQIGVVTQMDIVITMKFHGMIFAAMCGVPFVALGQTRKIRQFCAEEGLSDLCIAENSLQKERFLDTFKLAERDGLSDKLLGISERNRGLVRAAASSI